LSISDGIGIAAYQSARGVSGMAVHHLCDEPIAVTANGLNARTCRPTLIQYSTKRRDLDRQIAVVDDGSRPDSSENLLFRQKVAAPLQQQREDVERT
jgi:hypothetical protein